MKQILTLLLLVPTIGMAQYNEEINYTFFGAGFSQAELDVPAGEVDAGGYGVELSFEVRDHIHLFGAYDSLELDDLDEVSTAQKTFGIGTHFNLYDRLSLYGRLGYVDIGADSAFAAAEDDGALLAAGVRFMAASGFEVRGGVSHVRLDETGNDTAFNAGAELFLTEAVSLNFDATFDDDSRSVLIGGRLYFGEEPERFRW